MQNLYSKLRQRFVAKPAPVSNAIETRILDQYVATPPSAENAINIFKGEWSSILPPPYEEITNGTARLFEDPRILWLIEAVNGVKNRTVLELGPLEGGHSYLMEKHGAAQVLAIEANTRAYLKCLIVKELLDLQQVQFLCGDFIEYLHQTELDFDLCIASGVLYHMRNPVERLALLTKRCKHHLFIWTHYYDSEVIEASPLFAPRFHAPVVSEYLGFKHTLCRREYLDALGWSGFCGGSASYCNWMPREDILRALEHFGFGNVRIAFEAPDHQNGPSFALVADRLTTDNA